LMGQKTSHGTDRIGLVTPRAKSICL
jgi:hypothetical protein